MNTAPVQGAARLPGRPRIDTAARRERVVEALWQLVVRDGLDAATARSVAAEAGLSLGAVTRVFATQDELHLAAMTRVAERVERRLAELAPAEDPLTTAEEQLAQVLPLTPETHVEASVYYAYLARAGSSAELRAVADAVDVALLALCRGVVVALAPALDDADGRARELHALTEGLAFGLVTWPHRRSPAQARATLRAWLDRLSAPTPPAAGARGAASRRGPG